MGARVGAGLAAVAAVVALVVWGLSPGGSSGPAVRSAGTAAPSGTSPSPAPTGPAGTWRLKFASHFSGRKLNTKVWATCYPWVHSGAGCTNFGNREYQWYLPSQVKVSGGVLRLTARRTPTQGRNIHGGAKTYACRSGMVTTFPGFRFKYGYVQVVARIPQRQGLWPALWLAASNLRWPPEIDLLEHWGVNKTTGVYLHPVGAPKVVHHIQMPDLAARWHTFSLLWSRSYLIYRIDGHNVLTLREHIPHQSMFFIANVAEAGRPHAGSGCEGTMLIRSVKIWQQR